MERNAQDELESEHKHKPVTYGVARHERRVYATRNHGLHVRRVEVSSVHTDHKWRVCISL
jgi:hypothetical protein